MQYDIKLSNEDYETERKKEITLDLQIKDLIALDKELQFTINMEKTKLDKDEDLEREVKNLQDSISAVETGEIYSLKVILEEQNQLIIALKDEKYAFEKHQQLLDEQNRKLISELDRLVSTSEALQKTLDKRERVTELKERQRNTTM